MSEKENFINEIIEMAWCDKTSFDDIQAHTGLTESETMKVMRHLFFMAEQEVLWGFMAL